MLGIDKHRRVRVLLSSYVDGQVSDAETRRVEEHLASCAECRRDLETLRATVGLLKGLPEVVPASALRLDSPPIPVRGPWAYVWATRLATSFAAFMLAALLLGDSFELVRQTGDLVATTAEERAAQAFEPAPVVAMAALAPTIEQQDDQASAEAAPVPLAAAAPAPMAAMAAAAAAPEQPPTGATEETEVVAESAVQAAAPPVATASLSEEPQTKAARAGPVSADIAAAPGAQAMSEPVAQPTEEDLAPTAKGVGLPLWQLEVASGVVLVTLLTATIWTTLRRRRRFG